MLGGIQTLAAGVTAPVIGALYETYGRDVAYSVSAIAMVALVVGGVVLAGPAWGLRDELGAGATDLATADLADSTVVPGSGLTGDASRR